MARYPGAIWRPITAGKGRRSLTVYNRVNLHVTASNATSQHGYFNQSGIPDSHFHVRKDGSVEQYVDTSMQAFADLEGNDATISIETQGTGGGKWTPAQFETIAQVVAWAMRTHGIDRKMATNSKPGSSSRGLSWHRLGIDGNFPSSGIQAGRLQRGGGMHYSSHFGKVCPGNERVDQIPALFDRVTAILGGASTPELKEGFLMALDDDEQKSLLWNVRQIKKHLDDDPTLWNVRQIKAKVDAQAAVIETLARNVGVDPKVVTAAIEKALADLTVTLTNKES